ncbi:hypothetical protein Q0F99_19265 [Rathayibacter oskolensis]|uniref:hypothetical protein n=1 Tax=Rathayibacter oskolensis TaxID=1891671 RepID=UPI00265E3751|nr:hypothetical protein [Rathayibacter oskolensis]WKK71479.1 hypothetical protein Q0F99_19265 [Rathayibacter oskolensis]
MSKYNEGDEVVVTGNSVDHQFKIGEKIRVTQPGQHPFEVSTLIDTTGGEWRTKTWPSSDLSWDTLSVGDLIFDDDGDPHRVFWCRRRDCVHRFQRLS